MRRFLSIGLALCWAPFVGHSQSLEEKAKALAQSPSWLRLLHYVPRGSGFRSEVDGSGFFFAKQGRRDPLAELQASWAAFATSEPRGVFKLHPQCAFPERFRWLRQHLGWTGPVVPCPKLDEYMALFKEPSAVSVVFSSAFPNNPASMFGHTFLKIHTKMICSTAG